MTLAGVTNREKLLALLTGGVIVGVLAVTVLIEPQLKARKSHLAQLRELRFQLAKMTEDVLVKNRIEQAYEGIESLIVGNGTDQQEISIFTRDLSGLYAGLNIRTKSMKILPTKHEEHYRLLSIRIEFQSPAREAIKFILAIETHPKPLCIEQIVFKAQEAADSVYGSLLVTKVVTGQGGST